MSVDHYENFPVASVLCPAALRPAVVAIYRFARTADDLADEGPETPSQRLEALQNYRSDLTAALAGRPDSGRWPSVFLPLREVIERYALPRQPLFDLLDAFVQDVNNPPYETRADLLAYCRLSANPVGRLMLHLHGVADPRWLERSDAICSALQLINFWQDLSVDLPRGRVYLPRAECRSHGLDLSELGACAIDDAAMRPLVASLCDWARSLMNEGAPLAFALPGRSGWELRLVVQGGLRVLEKMADMDHGTWQARPTLKVPDAIRMTWRALCMQRPTHETCR